MDEVRFGGTRMEEATKLLDARLKEIMKSGGQRTTRVNQNTIGQLSEIIEESPQATHGQMPSSREPLSIPSGRSFLPIDELATGGQPQVFGAQGDTYITPFITTVFYHDRSVFETVIANMVKTAQLITIPDGGIKCAQYSYLSPNVLMFDATTEDIDYCIREGFQTCIVFKTLTTAANAILAETVAVKDSNAAPSYIRYADIHHPDDLYPLLIAKTSAAFICELAMATLGTFECASNITPARGKYFLAALAESNISSRLTSILESYTGFEKIEKLITKGKISTNLYKKQFTAQLEAKQCYSLKNCDPGMAVSDRAQDHGENPAPSYLKVIALAGNCAGGPFIDWDWIRTIDADIIIFYLYANEWQVTLVPIAMPIESAISAIIPLDAVGWSRIRITNSNYITLAVSQELATYLLPFLT